MKAIKTTTTLTIEMLELFTKYKIKKSEALRRGLYLILEERKAGLSEQITPYNLRLKITRMAMVIEDLQKRLNNFREFSYKFKEKTTDEIKNNKENM